MIYYRKKSELHDEGISLRGISASTGNSRQKITEVIELAEKKGLMCPLDEEMDDSCSAIISLFKIQTIIFLGQGWYVYLLGEIESTGTMNRP